ncbi:hypothetical protein [Chryseobacterium sp. R2A-55]|uniref:hypothetical protein n=1 Tax=Chryseobacterium sp. R2A-55 TaxID=2744445 RepID=UPI001F3578D7|nr:hypothetical protein [Chryseobacterium sp. R2A-55]
MKVTLKTDPETLFLIHKITNDQCQMIAANIGRKAGKSMRMELFSILTQRCFSYTQNPNGKKLQLTLKYHLAALLYELITDNNKFNGIYESNKIEIFKNELHQKLL